MCQNNQKDIAHVNINQFVQDTFEIDQRKSEFKDKEGWNNGSTQQASRTLEEQEEGQLKETGNQEGQQAEATETSEETSNKMGLPKKVSKLNLIKFAMFPSSFQIF